MAEFKPNFDRLRKVLLRDGEPDVIPFYDYFADSEVMEAVTGKPSSMETQVEFQYKLGYDYVNAGIRLGYKRKTVHTEDTAQLTGGERYFSDDNSGIIECRADFDAYQWPTVDNPAELAQSIHKASALLPDGMKIMLQMPGGVLENVMWLMGYIPFSYAIHDDEQMVSDLFELIGTNHLRALKLCLENSDISKIGAVALADDMGFNHSTMIAPELLRKYVFPWHKKIVELAHHYDLPMLLHACGNLETVMDDLIDDVGIDAKQSFEDKIMPVTEVKKKYGNRIAIMGGVDVHAICTLEEDALRAYVRNIIDICAPGGGYAMGTGNTVANYIPLKNFYIMLDETRKHGIYPISR